LLNETYFNLNNKKFLLKLMRKALSYNNDKINCEIRANKS